MRTWPKLMWTLNYLFQISYFIPFFSCMVSSEKSAVILILIPSYFLPFFNFRNYFIAWISWSFNIISPRWDSFLFVVCLFFRLACCCLSFLNMYYGVIICKQFWRYYFKYSIIFSPFCIPIMILWYSLKLSYNYLVFCSPYLCLFMNFLLRTSMVNVPVDLYSSLWFLVHITSTGDLVNLYFHYGVSIYNIAFRFFF